MGFFIFNHPHRGTRRLLQTHTTNNRTLPVLEGILSKAPYTNTIAREVSLVLSNPADELPELMPSPLLNEIEPELWMVAVSLTLWSGIGYLGYILYKRCLSKRDVQTPVYSTKRAISM